MLHQTKNQTSPSQSRLKNREISEAAGGCMSVACTQRTSACSNFIQVSWLRLNCESLDSLCIQKTQNIFPLSFCHLNLLWLQKEVPPRTFNCLGKGSLRAPDGVSDSNRGLGRNRPALSSHRSLGSRPQSGHAASKGRPSLGEASSLRSKPAFLNHR